MKIESHTGEDASRLAAVFGPGSGEATDARAWAKRSTIRFVRSQTQLARWSPGATGKSMSAFESLEAFGWPVLEQLADGDSAIIVREGCEISAVLRDRREATGFTQAEVSTKSKVSESDIRAAEEGRRRSPIRMLQRLAQTLALDADRLGAVRDGGGDPRLGVRLRDIHQSHGSMSPPIVLGLAEAAWIIATQGRLESWLLPERRSTLGALGFSPSPLAPQQRPPWRQGMDLAHRTRRLLGLQQHEPIRGFKTLLEDRLAIPVVSVDLPQRFAGATIANGDARGVVTNVTGINENVWVRRMTMAHELGHLLWDCEEDLNRLRVDEEGVDDDPGAQNDPVETRANAFAAELLAPQAAVIEAYTTAGGDERGVSAVMQRFGVSFTATKWQVFNGMHRMGNPPTRSLRDTKPEDDWRADEDGTLDFFPLKDTPIQRRGRFARLTLRACEENLIGEDTAADYLSTSAQAFHAAKSSLTSLFGVD